MASFVTDDIPPADRSNAPQKIMSVKQRIEEVCAAEPDLKKRWKAMKGIKWVLFCPQLGLYAGLRGLDIVPVAKGKAQVFDGRDNEELKARFYRASTGIDFQPTLL